MISCFFVHIRFGHKLPNQIAEPSPRRAPEPGRDLSKVKGSWFHLHIRWVRGLMLCFSGPEQSSFREPVVGPVCGSIPWGSGPEMWPRLRRGPFGPHFGARSPRYGPKNRSKNRPPEGRLLRTRKKEHHATDPSYLKPAPWRRRLEDPRGCPTC